MPAIVARSISILSDAGLGMAMFSLGKLIMNLLRILCMQDSQAFQLGKLLLSISLFWLESSQQAKFMGCRFIHGTSAKNYCMWKHRGDLFHGSSIPNRSCGHGCCLNCCGVERCSSAHCYRAGNSSPIVCTQVLGGYLSC